MKVLLVTYRRIDLLARCISQLTSYVSQSDILVVDNRSSESNSIANYCARAGVTILQNPTNEGFAKAVNTGMRRLISETADPWVLLINPDTELRINPVELTKLAERDWACITTFDGSAQAPWDCEKPMPSPWRAAWEDAGLGRVRLPQPLGSRYRSFSEKNRGYLVGCFLIISTAAWKRIGDFDARFWLYSEETDWCLRAYRAGMKCKVMPVVGYLHEARQASVGDATATRRSLAAYQKSRLLFIKKHWGNSGVLRYRFYLTSLDYLRRLTHLRHKLIDHLSHLTPKPGS